MAKSRTVEPDWGRFELATPDDDTRNIIAASEGRGGSGKSHFWLTAPDPIAYFLFDPGGLKGLKNNELFRGRDIRIIDYSRELNPGKLSQDDRVKFAIDTLAHFEEDWNTAIPLARTLVWDKEDYVWEMLRYANDEGVNPEPKNFYEMNMQYRGWFTEAEAMGKNFGVIRGMKEVWGKTGGVSRNTGKAQMGFTGEQVPRGQKEVPELVQVNMSHRWDKETRKFIVTILEKCRIGDAPRLMGKEFASLDFLTLATMLYPESEPSEWGFE